MLVILEFVGVFPYEINYITEVLVVDSLIWVITIVDKLEYLYFERLLGCPLLLLGRIT